MPRVELEVESLSKGGDGVAHHEGQVVFVPRSAPGDRVEVELVQRGRGVLEGRLTQLLVPGDRVVPPCALAEVCGGCAWMHVRPDVQASQKERLFYDALARLGGVARAELDAQPIQAAPQGLAYRRRARLHVRQGQLGYLREGTHTLVPIPTCPVLEPVLDRAVAALPQALTDGQLWGKVTEIDLVCEGEAWSLALHAPALTGQLRARVEKLVAQVGARGAVLRVDQVAPLLIGKPVLGTLRPDVFAQVNAASNALLVSAAMERLRPAPEMRLLELFCGSGNFTLPALAAGAQVVAVEHAGPALGLLRDAAEKRGLRAQLRIMEGDALKLTNALAAEGQRFSACLLDPPRAGASGLGPGLRALGVERVVYASCDPATLARDLGELRSAGFKPVWARPFDLFPQTPHVEGLVLLER